MVRGDVPELLVPDRRVDLAGSLPVEQSIGALWASRRASLRVAAAAFVLNRLILTAISVLTSKLFYDVPGRSFGLFDLWHRWDVRWFTQVAEQGYRWSPPPMQSDLAFFPLYPLGMHLVAALTPLSSYAAGLCIANVSFLVALYLLHRLVMRDVDPDAAERAVTYIALFPTALFFFAAYSEALYLACCIGCIYALRLRRWWLAGICGAAAALTRQLGMLLVVPFLIEYLDSGRELGVHPRYSLQPLAALALIPAAVALFMAYLQRWFGDGLLFVRAQSAWQRRLEPPWEGPLVSLNHLVQLPLRLSWHTRQALQALSFIDLSFLALFLALLAIGATLLPRSYSLYTAAVLLAILVNPATGYRQPLALMSITRFEVTLFPPFIVLALLGRRRPVDRTVLALSVSLLTLFTILFVRGRWIA